MPPMDLFTLYQAISVAPTPAETLKRGRPTIGTEAITKKEFRRREIERARAEQIENIAILDMETDPFDKSKPNQKIEPFLAVLYRDDADPVVIWQEHQERFCDEVLAAIEALPGKFTVYAHNGGKFDYMFLLHRLRGFVSFKGRGIMAAQVGRHQLRDSYHIIPDRLANIQKDKFSYEKMKRGLREKHRAEIIKYCINDCRYLLDVVKKFVGEFGLKLSIGQAALADMRKHYKIKHLGENQDAFLRNYFFGGRVECLAGRGHYRSADIGGQPFRLYDVNSMYPRVMADRAHPIGNDFSVRRGSPTEATCFLELTCRNFGGLVARDADGNVTAEQGHGTFRTTIWEYRTALRFNLIDRVEIKWCIDFAERTDFSFFVLPRYAHRQETKKFLKQLRADGRQDTPVYFDALKDDLFDKLVLNNSFGKQAQNPRKFKECYITAPGEIPAVEDCGAALRQLASLQPECVNEAILKEWGQLPAVENPKYWIWERPAPHMRFNNVATAASITGAARAVLMEAIALAYDPIYCDTDSLICRGLHGVEIHNENLGAWKVECEIDEAIIAGKKLYGYKVAGLDDGHKERVKIRSKGVADLTWRDLERILDDQIAEHLRTVETVNFAPTFTKLGTQSYMRRVVRATGPRGARRIVQHKRAIA